MLITRATPTPKQSLLWLLPRETLLASGVENRTLILTTSGHLQNQIDTIDIPDSSNALVGADGITVVIRYGYHDDTLGLPRRVRVAASGFLNDHGKPFWSGRNDDHPQYGRLADSGDRDLGDWNFTGDTTINTIEGRIRSMASGMLQGHRRLTDRPWKRQPNGDWDFSAASGIPGGWSQRRLSPQRHRDQVQGHPSTQGNTFDTATISMDGPNTLLVFFPRT